VETTKMRCKTVAILRDTGELSLMGHFLGSELGADSLDLKLELIAAYKLYLMHVDVKVVA
jgi:hypothetical protein